MKKKRLSIIVPVLNEESNIKNTVKEILYGLDKLLDDFEILIFNDSSTDNTGNIVEQLTKNNEKIKVIHNRINRGMGYCYQEGLRRAKFEYFMYIPGDNQLPGKALKKLIRQIGNADIVIPYVTNMYIRSLLRQFVSHTFTLILNFLFGLNVPYYNGTVIHRAELLRGVRFQKDSGHAYQADILVRLIKSDATYVTVGYNMYERSSGTTSAFRFNNIKRVFKTILNLFWEVNIKHETFVSSKVRQILKKQV